MSQTQLIELQTVFVKVEATEGTDAVPTAGDAVQLFAPATLAVGAERDNTQEQRVDGFLDEAPPIQPSGLYGEVTLRFWSRGHGSAYSAGNKPEVDAIAQANGLSSTGSFTGGSEKYDYETASTSTKTVTIYGFQQLETGVYVRHTILATRGSRLALTADAAAPGVIEAVLRGIYVAPADQSFITPTYKTTVAPLFAGAASWSFNAVAPVVRSSGVAWEQTLVPRWNANAVVGNLGLAGYMITHRRNSWQAVVEASRIADFDPFTEWKGANKRALVFDIAAGAGAQYNRNKVRASNAVMTAPPAMSDDNGIVVYNLSGLCGPDGADRLKLTYD